MISLSSIGTLFIRLLIGSAFTFAGIVKIGTAVPKPPALTLIPNLPIALFGIALPWIELIFGLMIISGMAYNHAYILRTARILIGSIFIFAAIDKIANPDAFAKSINNFHVLPYSMINIPALILPWVELLCGILVLMGIKQKASSLLISAMLAVFIIAIIVAIFRGYNINCGCFGENSPAAAAEVTKVGWTKVIEDLRWLIASLFLYFYSERQVEEEV